MDRMVIGLCDDEQIVRRQLRNLVESVIIENGYYAEILEFQSGEKLIEHVHTMDAVFLDIDMPTGINGIETGRRIRKIKYDCKVIIATKLEDCYKESFQINAFRYVTKPFDKTEIREALLAVWNTQIGTEILELYYNRTAYSIMQRDIAYIISFDSYTEMVVGGRIFRKEMSLNFLEKILEPKMFFRVHRQYIVNMKWIREYRTGIIWIEGKKIIVSRRRKKEFERAYIEFDLNYR